MVSYIDDKFYYKTLLYNDSLPDNDNILGNNNLLSTGLKDRVSEFLSPNQNINLTSIKQFIETEKVLKSPNYPINNINNINNYIKLYSPLFSGNQLPINLDMLTKKLEQIDNRIQYIMRYSNISTQGM